MAEISFITEKPSDKKSLKFFFYLLWTTVNAFKESKITLIKVDIRVLGVVIKGNFC